MSQLSNLQLRIIAGVIGGFLIVGSIVGGSWSYFFIFFAIGSLSLYEFYRLFREKEIFPNIVLGLVINAFNYSSMFLVSKNLLSPHFFVFNICLILSVFIYELYRKKKNPFLNIAITLLGNVYITLPFMFMHPLSFLQDSYSFVIVLTILLMLWGNDSGAYAFGKALGKHKLFERISPNKTWEGFFGGILVSTIIGFITYYIFQEYSSFDRLALYEFLLLGIFVGVFATLGDLFESLLKRNLGIKDSGTIIPGHGGFLDRFDGLLLITPLVYTYFILI